MNNPVDIFKREKDGTLSLEWAAGDYRGRCDVGIREVCNHGRGGVEAGCGSV